MILANKKNGWLILVRELARDERGVHVQYVDDVRKQMKVQHSEKDRRLFTNVNDAIEWIGDIHGEKSTKSPVLKYSYWKHRNGNVYQVKEITNLESTNPQYPVTVVYQNVHNHSWWSRPLHDWHNSMVPFVHEEELS